MMHVKFYDISHNYMLILLISQVMYWRCFKSMVTGMRFANIL